MTEGDEDKTVMFNGKKEMKTRQSSKEHMGHLPKSASEEDMLMDFQETFDRIRSINMKLNPKKCSFDVKEGPFLGHLITKQGIKANPSKVKAITDLKPLRTLKEIQSLNGKLAALSQFFSKGADKSLLFFKALKSCTNKKTIQWTTNAEEGFQKMKEFIETLPMLTAPIKGEVLKKKIWKPEAANKAPNTWKLYTDGASSSDGLGAASGLRPYHFTYPERRLTMEEMLYKFIDEGKRKHEEMRTFICEFQATNEILFKERNNSLSDLKFEVQELLKVIDNTPMINFQIKGVTTRGGKTTTHDVQTNSTNIHTEEPVVVNHDKPVESNEVLDKDQPQTTNKPVIQTSSEEQTPSIPLPRRVRKENEEAEQRKFLENLKQLHINFPFIEDLAQMPKYAKFLKGLLTNKARLEEASEDDECYGIDDLYDIETPELLENDRIPYDVIDLVITPYSSEQKNIATRYRVKSEHLYSASTNEIDEKRLELKSLPNHLEYAYLHGDKSFPIIISSKLSKMEKKLLLQVLEKHRGEIA
ncbi:hypothetical protein Tco_1406743 [Tanacetum coccineum]